MPEFDANDDLERLPGTQPEGDEDPAEIPSHAAGRGAETPRARNRLTRRARRREGRFGPTLRARRRARRLACRRPPAAGPARPRRARCQTLRAKPRGPQG